MFKKLLLCALSTLAPSLLLATDLRKKVVIPYDETTTVGDIMSTVIDGEKVFKIASAPYFFNFFNMPAEFNAMFNDQLTLRSFVRFLSRSKKLFSKETTQKTYVGLIDRAIKKHAEYSISKKPATLEELEKIESKIFNLLSELYLSDPEINKKLSSILSTPVEPTLYTMTQHLTFSHPAKIINNQNGQALIKVKSLSHRSLITAFFGVAALLSLIFSVKTSNSTYGTLGLTGFIISFINADKNYPQHVAMHPEPGNGINVSFKKIKYPTIFSKR